MRIIRRTFTLILTLAVLLAGFTFPEAQGNANAETVTPTGIAGTYDVGVQPDELLQSGEWLYYLDGDEAIIAGYLNKEAESLIIPYTINNHIVRGIGSEVFCDMVYLKSISIHSFINRIAKSIALNNTACIIAYSGAYAIEYAKMYGIPYKNMSNNNNYEFNASVIDFSGFSKKYYSISEDNSIRVSKNISTLLNMSNVVYFPEYSTELHLYAYEIAGITSYDEYSIISTRDISDFTSFLDRVCFDNQKLEMDTSQIVILNDGVTIDETSSAGKFSHGFNNSASFSVNLPLGPNVTLTGNISSSFSGTASLEIETFPLPSVKTANITLCKSLGYSLSVTGSVSKKETKVKLFQVPVRGGPFSFWFTVQLSVSLSGTISVSGGIKASLSLIKERGQNWKLKPVFEKEQPHTELSVKVDVSIPVEVYAELGVEIGSVGLALKFIAVKVTPGIEATGKKRINPNSVLQCVDVSGTLYITISASVGCLEVVFGNTKWSNLWKFELSHKETLLSYSFHLDNIAQGILYKKVDHCLVNNRDVVFIKNNGEKDYITTCSGGQVLVEPGEPKKTGKVFDGWFFSPTQSDLSGIDFKWNFAASTRLPYLWNPGSRYVFYAKWRDPDQPPSPYGEPTYSDDHDDDGSTWHTEPPKPIEVSIITLNKTDEILHVDGQYKDKLYLSASVYPANAANTSVTWSSSNPAVASVDNSGVVSALAEGETIITCKSNMVPRVTATCKVTVFQPIYVKSITLDKTSAELWANESDKNTLQLKATVDPANATYSSVHWSSSNENVAWVDGWGKVTGLSAGTATIKCQSIKNQDVIATCQITVHQHVQNVYVTAERQGILPSETVQLSALCYPTNADNKKVAWSSSDASIASVDTKGLVTARKYGTATITATASDGAKAAGNYKVSVERELTLNGDVQNSKLYLDGGNSVVIGYAYATQGSVRRMIEHGYDLEWKLLNGSNAVADAYIDVVPTVYTVNGKEYSIPSAVLYSGELHKAGTATFTLQCKAGSYTATVDLKTTVSGEKLAKSVKLNPSKFELGINEVARIPITPLSADGGVVPKILSVSISGDRYYCSHAHESGDAEGRYVWFPESGQYTAKVIYKAVNTTYTVPVTFEVRDENGIMHLPVTSVALSDSFVNMVVGDTCQLSAEVSPTDAYDRSVTWTSDDTSIATVSQNGKVTAKKRGMVYIRCEANDGSGCYDSCVINVEPFMALNETNIEKTIYMDGETNTAIDSCSLTYQSALRIEEKGLTPNWTLKRVSGDATEIALYEFTSTAEGNVRIEGEEIQLLRANHTGTDRYRLTCEAGNYSASCDITLKVVKSGNLPKSIALVTNRYETTIGEAVEIDTSIVCTPSTAKLPDDANIAMEPSKAFLNAMEENTYFGDFSCTFAEAGEYTAELVYSGANYRYAVPFTVRVKDENGNVPVAVQDIVMSKELPV